MGKTISEKILAKAAGKEEVSPGEIVYGVSAPYVLVGFDLGGGGFVKEFKKLGLMKPFDPKRIVLVSDHCGDSRTRAMSEGIADVMRWAKKYGVPAKHIHDLGRQGNRHQIAADYGYAVPGALYFTSDGHTTELGAMGAYATCLSKELPAYLLRGWTWFRVPETVKLNLTGRLGKCVMGRDAFEYSLSKIGLGSAVYKALEFTGPVVDDMSIDGRLSMTGLALFAGATTGIINPDKKTIDHVKARTDIPFTPLTSDPDAEYVKVYNIDVSDLEPQVVVPPYRNGAKPISEVEGIEVDVGYIGSCASGRMEDLRIAAKILKGNKLHEGVILNITVGSTVVNNKAMREGIIPDLAEAGAFLASVACGMCFGGHTPLAAGQTCITSSTTNYPGRMGSQDAKVYLANPATIAASMIEGKITDPRKYL